MRLRFLLLVLTISLTASAAAAQAKKGAGKKPAAKPSMEEMMKVWLESAKPGAQHRVLDQLAGEWDMTMRFWMEPGKPPTESKGSAVTKWVLDGRFLQEDATAEWMGMPYSGTGLTGYDNFKKKYVLSWADNMTTALLTAQGAIGRDGSTITFFGKMDDPMTGERNKTVKFVTRILDKDKHVFEGWDQVGTPREFKAMEIVYTRKGSGGGR